MRTKEPHELMRLRPFRRLMRTLSLPPGSGFVDFGCGKGRVLLLAAGFGFARITGVEFAKELCDIAKERGPLPKEDGPAYRDPHCSGGCRRVRNPRRRQFLLHV